MMSRRWATCHQDLGGTFTVIGMISDLIMKGVTEMEMKKSNDTSGSSKILKLKLFKQKEEIGIKISHRIQSEC